MCAPVQPQCLTPACLTMRQQLVEVIEKAHQDGVVYWDIHGILLILAEVYYLKAGIEHFHNRSK